MNEEYCVLQLFCSESGKEFSVVMRRLRFNNRFEVFDVFASFRQALVAVPSSVVVNAEKLEPIDFDFSGFHCICGWDLQSFLFVECSQCRRLICGKMSFLSEVKDRFICNIGCGGMGLVPIKAQDQQESLELSRYNAGVASSDKDDNNNSRNDNVSGTTNIIIGGSHGTININININIRK